MSKNNKGRRIRGRIRATAFVRDVNATTFCARCGKQPIEWHRTEHVDHSNWRISSLRTQGASLNRIKDELALCTPYCRSCHMLMDSRRVHLDKSKPQQKGKIYVPALPCNICARIAKPKRRGMCYTCYERHRVGGRQFQHTLSDGCCGTYNFNVSEELHLQQRSQNGGL